MFKIVLFSIKWFSKKSWNEKKEIENVIFDDYLFWVLLNFWNNIVFKIEWYLNGLCICIWLSLSFVIEWLFVLIREVITFNVL